jgi:hypothetical protein
MIGSSGGATGAAGPVAFSGTIVPTALSASYRFGLVLVTVAMILVPLLYLHLFLAGLQKVDGEQFGLAEPTLAGAQSTQAWATAEQNTLSTVLEPFEVLIVRRLGLGVLMLERQGRGDEARAVIVALTALTEAVPIAVDARRHVMAIAYLSEATPLLGSSSHLRERTATLHTALENGRTRALEIVNRMPPPPGQLEDMWKRLATARQVPPAEFMQRVMELYWACLSRLARLMSDAESAGAISR